MVVALMLASGFVPSGAQNLPTPAEILSEHYASTRVPDRVILTWTSDPATSQAVTWRMAAPAGTAVAELAEATASPKFGQGAERFDATTSAMILDGVSSFHHTVNFTGLTPDTLYAYRVGDGQIWSEWCHFRTAKRESAPFSFIYFGDAQNQIKSLWSRVIRQAYSNLPDASFMLHAGDLVNVPHSDLEWSEWFEAGGWLNCSTPSIATPGNHEYRDGKLSPQWRPHFAFPHNGPAFPGLEETVYYLDYQGVRFISLDTEAMVDAGGPAVAVAQARWLDEVLKTNPHRWTIVTHHRPMFSARASRTNSFLLNYYIKPLYEKYGVDLVLQGHDHSYARGENLSLGGRVLGRHGVPMYVVSVSGPKMYPGGADWPERSLTGTQLYQLVTVDGDRLRFEAYTATGELFDAFELHKAADGTSEVLEFPTSDAVRREAATAVAD